jgi:siroheme synthase (precorrin-2 oxidase/ferrochelatase)
MAIQGALGMVFDDKEVCVRLFDNAGKRRQLVVSLHNQKGGEQTVPSTVGFEPRRR